MESIKDILARKTTIKKQATAHQQLAADIAESFSDVRHIGVYLKICKRFDMNLVRKAWKETLEARPNNPGAYFTSVVYARSKK